MRTVLDVRRQLKELCQRLGVGLEGAGFGSSRDGEALLRSLLGGLFTNVADHTGEGKYLTVSRPSRPLATPAEIKIPSPTRTRTAWQQAGSVHSPQLFPLPHPASPTLLDVLPAGTHSQVLHEVEACVQAQQCNSISALLPFCPHRDVSVIDPEWLTDLAPIRTSSVQ